ncbi:MULTISPECIES: ester cyclase [Leptospira]|uniref:ester cyclase n=1 Tax=Leptospira TaxID=171 RepID=UPI001EEA9151|nr:MULTISPECIES: ester cyclase [Leptospira]MCG6146611.1 ester cyclase [Leptospira bandrabouensis]MCW7471712.1 ester cyclase [Leptospira kanakyensis]MCW7478344.1 ester cyclase [Leptospira bandrabouensis]MCW7485534.1 ester cyclase [Leptospira bandrabouensis]
MKKIIVEEFIKATNSRNWKKVLSLTHSNFIRHSSSIPNEIHGNHSLVEFHKNELKTFPDLDEKIEFLIEENDLVAARIKFTGTQKGKLGKLAPSNKILSASFNCFFKIVDNKISDTWVEYDNLNGLMQLGHINSDLI